MRQNEAHSLPGYRGGRASQDTERKQHNESHLLSKDHIERHTSGHEKNETKRRELTSWRPHREEQVRTHRECYWAKGTHSLPTETASGGTSQDT